MKKIKPYLPHIALAISVILALIVVLDIGYQVEEYLTKPKEQHQEYREKHIVLHTADGRSVELTYYMLMVVKESIDDVHDRQLMDHMEATFVMNLNNIAYEMTYPEFVAHHKKAIDVRAQTLMDASNETDIAIKSIGFYFKPVRKETSPSKK